MICERDETQARLLAGLRCFGGPELAGRSTDRATNLGMEARRKCEDFRSQSSTMNPARQTAERIDNRL